MKISVAAAVAIALTTFSYAAPSNDDFADAIVIDGLPACDVQANSMEATLEEGEPPLIGTRADQGSIWFRWTAEADGLVRFDLSGFITGDVPFEIDAFTGESVGALTEVGTTSRFFNRANEVAVAATAGTTYHIRVSGLGFSIYAVALQVSSVALPPNDDFADATEIPASQTFPIQLSHDNSLATIEAGEDSDEGVVERSLWYSWEVPADGRYKIAEVSLRSRYFALDTITLVDSEEDDDSDNLFQGADTNRCHRGTIYKIRVASQIFFGTVSDAGLGFLNISRVERRLRRPH